MLGVVILSNDMLSVYMLSVIVQNAIKLSFNCTEWHNKACNAGDIILIVDKLSVIMQDVIMLKCSASSVRS
jgi:hypothetical protein